MNCVVSGMRRRFGVGVSTGRALRQMPRAVVGRGIACHLAFLLGLTAFATAGVPDGLQSTALAPRSGPPGPTLFTMLPPEQTGIVTTNDYADPKMWAEHYQ